jgi:hypothetical protein
VEVLTKSPRPNSAICDSFPFDPSDKERRLELAKRVVPLLDPDPRSIILVGLFAANGQLQRSLEKMLAEDTLDKGEVNVSPMWI